MLLTEWISYKHWDYNWDYNWNYDYLINSGIIIMIFVRDLGIIIG